MVKIINIYILTGNPEGRDHLKNKLRWDHNIKTDLRIVCGSMDWIQLARSRDRWRALVNESSGPVKGGLFVTELLSYDLH
jgi:hypothetical protein